MSGKKEDFKPSGVIRLINVVVLIVVIILAIIACVPCLVICLVCPFFKSCRKKLMIFLKYFFGCSYFSSCAKHLFTLVKSLLYLLLAAIALCLFVLTAAVHFGIAVSTGCICFTLMPPICLFKWFKGRNLKASEDKKEL